MFSIKIRDLKGFLPRLSFLLTYQPVFFSKYVNTGKSKQDLLVQSLLLISAGSVISVL